MTAPSMGVLAQLGMGTTSTVSEAYEFKSEGLSSERQIVDTAGIRGSRSRVIERTRQGIIAPGGPIVLEPNPTELRALLPRIMGGAEAGGGPYTYTLAETLPTWYASVDRVAKVYVYNHCAVDKATFRAGAPGTPLELSLEIEALSETINNAGTFPALTIDAHPPFVFFDGVLTLGGTGYQMQSVELTIDNMLKKDRFVNSQTRTDLPAMDRTVALRCTVPYTADTVGLYDGGVSGVTATLVFTSATSKVLSITLGNVIFPAKKSPVVPNKDEITLLLEGMVLKTGSTLEVAVSVTP